MCRSSRAILLAAILLVGLATIMTAQVRTPESLQNQLTSLLPDLSEDDIQTLITDGEVSNLYAASDGPRLVPSFRVEIAAELAALRPALGVEVLRLVETPGDMNLLRSYSILQSISTMAGIEYFSASRGYYRTLFHESYLVEDPLSRTPRPDRKPTVVPEQETLYAFQRDSSFGRNVYEITYRTSDTAILLSMKNLTRMMYRGVIPAMGPEKLLMHITVIPGDQFTVLYGSSGVDSLNALGIEERVRDSFYNRIVALHTWYLARGEAGTD